MPHFSMRPHPAVTGSLIFVLLVGFLIAMSFFAKEDGTGVYMGRAILTLIVTGIITICLVILATAKFWFPHLWKKNSTHARHKQHSKYHPAVKEQEHRRRR